MKYGHLQNQVLILIVLAAVATLASSKLVYTFTLARHGAVYPPNDLYDGNQTKAYRGRLTPIGLRQHYNLGTYLKQDYITQYKLAAPKFNPNEVEFYSTSKLRTQNSALSFIYGFYPLGEGWTIPPEVPSDKLVPPYTPLFPQYLSKSMTDSPFALNKGFQPLPVRPLDDILDNCPNYDNLLAKRLQEVSKTIQDFENYYFSLLSNMKILFNLTSSQLNLQTMSDLYDTVVSDLNLGRAMPADFKEEDKKNLKYMYEFYNSLLFGGNFARVLATPSLRMIKEKLTDVQKGSNKLKASFVFGHHSNVLPLLSVLDLTSPECITQKWKMEPVSSLNCVSPPPYAANLILQLHLDEITKSQSVRIRYNGYYTYTNSQKQVDWSFSAFMTMIENGMTNFEEQCKISSQMIKAATD